MGPYCQNCGKRCFKLGCDGALVATCVSEKPRMIVALWNEQSRWSQRTFGSDTVRGPIGPLKHLVKEAGEALADPHNKTEYADCLLLVMDASRRAGVGLEELLVAAWDKLRVNRYRNWPAPTGNDESVEHLPILRGDGTAMKDTKSKASTSRPKGHKA